MNAEASGPVPGLARKGSGGAPADNHRVLNNSHTAPRTLSQSLNCQLLSEQMS